MNRDDLITPSEGNKSGDVGKTPHVQAGIGKVDVKIPLTQTLKLDWDEMTTGRVLVFFSGDATVSKGTLL